MAHSIYYWWCIWTGCFISAVLLERDTHFKAMQARKELSKELPIKQILARHKTAVVIGMMFTWF